MVVALKMTPPARPNRLAKSKSGLGDILKEIIARGGKKIILAVGGTATVDAGIGMFTGLAGRLTRELNIITDTKETAFV